jgi:exodeoxyribonuclease VII large subunit
VRLKNAILRDLSLKKVFLQQCASRLISPKDRLRDQAQRLDEVWERFARAMAAFLEKKGDLLARFGSQLDALSPLRVLERGYGLVREASTGEVIRSTKQWKVDRVLKITFFDGDRDARAL